MDINLAGILSGLIISTLVFIALVGFAFYDNYVRQRFRNGKKINVWKTQMIIATFTSVAEWSLTILQLAIGKTPSVSNITLTILWTVWLGYTYYKFKKDKK